MCVVVLIQTIHNILPLVSVLPESGSLMSHVCHACYFHSYTIWQGGNKKSQSWSWNLGQFIWSGCLLAQEVKPTASRIPYQLWTKPAIHHMLIQKSAHHTKHSLHCYAHMLATIMTFFFFLKLSRYDEIIPNRRHFNPRVPPWRRNCALLRLFQSERFPIVTSIRLHSKRFPT